MPEKPILVYPSLAATVGLEEAVLLATLSDMVSTQEGQWNNGFNWHMLSLKSLSEALPFWQSRDFQRVTTSMREKGILIIASTGFNDNDTFKFAFNEKSVRQQQAKPTQTLHNTREDRPEGGKNFIADHWQPDDTTLAQLAQLSVPSEFALEQVPEFVTYWRERGEAHRSWGQKFINHTIQRWRSYEVRQHRRSKATPIYSNWTPSEECMNELLSKNLPREFILDQIGEFIQFWQATEEKHLSWDTKFIQRVLSLWADREAKKNIATQEYKIHENWQPSEDALDVMTVKSGIPRGFIDDAIPEFIIYWKDKGLATTTWNSLFIKHVRLQWHRYQHSSNNTVEPQPISPQWQPSEDVYDILRMANIDAEFARALVPEFVLYWRDSNQIHNSWNTRFIRHAKKTWAQRHQLLAYNAPNSQETKSTRDMSLEELLTDRTWAE
ncbi:hypothetical protein TDB9533_02582 [Thalassocella blandensis]|nr:hypothetical protein TDB9533_02582 [Thalassocella blandensis]